MDFEQDRLSLIVEALEEPGTIAIEETAPTA